MLKIKNSVFKKTWFKYIIYLALVVINILIGILSGSETPVIVLSLLGNISLILYIEGQYVANLVFPVYGFGLIALSVQQKLYGQAIATTFAAIMALIMAVIWARKTSGGIVSARKSSKRFFLAVAGGWAFAVIISYIAMRLLNAEAGFLNAMQMVSKIYAEGLLLLRLFESQFFFTSADVASLGMWLITGNFVMAAQSVVAVLFDIQGIYNWKQLAAKSGEVYLASFERKK